MPDLLAQLAAIQPPTGWERVRAARARNAARQPHAGRDGRGWYRISAASDTAEILIYDEIGLWGVTAKDFVDELAGLDASTITVRINSPGGDVFDGVAIHNALTGHDAHVTTRVDSLAASAASFIAMAGDNRQVAKNATLMIHDASGLAYGNAADMREMADALDRVSDMIAGIYADRTGGTVKDWRKAMKAETWYSGQEAVDAGLADELFAMPKSEKAENRFDLSLFQHPPAALLRGDDPPDERPAPTKRTIEKALRDGGLSASQSKAFVAAGWNALEPPAEDGATRDVAALETLRDAVLTALSN